MIKELLEKLQNAKTDEERKQIIEENKQVLTDEELDQVAGGGGENFGGENLADPQGSKAMKESVDKWNKIEILANQ